MVIRLFEVTLSCHRTYQNPTEIVLYVEFTKGKEMVGTLSTMCEAKVLTLLGSVFRPGNPVCCTYVE